MKTIIKLLLIIILMLLIYTNYVSNKVTYESNIINFTEYNAEIFKERDRLELGWNGLIRTMTYDPSDPPNISYLLETINDENLSRLMEGYYRQIEKYKINNVEKPYTISNFKYERQVSFAKDIDLLDNICDNFIDEKLKHKAFFQKKYIKQFNGINYCYYIWDIKKDYSSKEEFIKKNNKTHFFILAISMDRKCIVWRSQGYL